MAEHKLWHILLIVSAVVAYILTSVFDGLAYTDAGVNSGLFHNKTIVLWEKYETDLTPCDWAFALVWSVIWAWQGIWLVYGVVMIFREGLDGGYFYYSPAIMPPTLYVWFIFNMAANVIWSVLWDRQELVASFVVLLLVCASLYICMVITYRALQREGPLLVRHGNRIEPFVIISLVQNGLALYTTWVTILVFIQLAVVMTYTGDVSVTDASTVSIALLVFSLVVWFQLDHMLLDKYTRATKSPYVVICLTLAAIIDRNYAAGNRNSNFIAVILGVSVLLLVLKLIISSVRHFRQPLWPTRSYDDVHPIISRSISTHGDI